MSSRIALSAAHGLSLALGLGLLLAAATAPAETIDFDDLQPGQIVTTITPVGFAHSEVGLDLVVSTGAVATSMPNYLGAAYLLGPSNDDQDLFLPGEALELSFDAPTHSISVAVVSTPGTPAGAFELVTASGSVTSDGIPDQFAGYDEVFLLSFSSSSPFTSAELRSSYAEGLFAFHVDDIVVPEPALAPLITAGIGLLAVLGGRRDRPMGR